MSRPFIDRDFSIGRISIALAPPTHAKGGLLGWATVYANGFIVDGVAIRMTSDDLLIVTLPARARGELGRRHPIVRIANRDHRQQFDDAVIDAFREAWANRGKGGAT